MHSCLRSAAVSPRQVEVMRVALRPQPGCPAVFAHTISGGREETHLERPGRSPESHVKTLESSRRSPFRASATSEGLHRQSGQMHETSQKQSRGPASALETSMKRIDRSNQSPIRVVGGPALEGTIHRQAAPLPAASSKDDFFPESAHANVFPATQPVASSRDAPRCADGRAVIQSPGNSPRGLPAANGSCKLIGQGVTCPDPLLTTGPQASPLSPMARTPSPRDRKNAWMSGLDSRQSLTSSFLGLESNSPPQYVSAKLLHSSSSKRRTLSPGASCVVLPPSPESVPRISEVLPSQETQDTPEAWHVQSTLFEIFCSPVSTPFVAEQVAKGLLSRSGEALWDELVLLRPVQYLACAVVRLLSGQPGQPVKDEGLWREHLGDEETYRDWWRALLARYGLYGSGDSLASGEATELMIAACRVLRDHFAKPTYLRNLRTVRFGAQRLHDRPYVQSHQDFVLGEQW